MASKSQILKGTNNDFIQVNLKFRLCASQPEYHIDLNAIVVAPSRSL